VCQGDVKRLCPYKQRYAPAPKGANAPFKLKMLIDDNKLRNILEGPDGGLCIKARDAHPPDNSDVTSVCDKAAAILLEINKFDGDQRPIFGHGYVHEKAIRMFNIIDRQNNFKDSALKDIGLKRIKEE
jgi:hypothetical protein